MVRRNIIIFIALVVGTSYLYYETFLTKKNEVKDDLPNKTTLKDNYWTLPKFRTRKLFSIQSGKKYVSNSALEDRGIAEHSENSLYPDRNQESFKRSVRKKRETPKSNKLYKWNINLNVTRRNNSDNPKIELGPDNQIPKESLGMAISLQGNGNEESYLELFNAWNSVEKLMENIFGGNVQKVAEEGHGVTLDVNRFPNKTQLHGETKKSEDEIVEQSVETKGREPKFIFGLFESGGKSQDLSIESGDVSTIIETITNDSTENGVLVTDTSVIENVETSTREEETTTTINGFSVFENSSIKIPETTREAEVTTNTNFSFPSTTEPSTVIDDSFGIHQLRDYCVWLLNNKTKSSRSLDHDESSGSGDVLRIEENSEVMNTELPKFSAQPITSVPGNPGVIVSFWNRLVGKSENKPTENLVSITEKPNLKSGSRFFNFNVFGLGSGLGRSAETGEEETIIFDSDYSDESKMPSAADCEEFLRNLQLESTFSKPNLADFLSHHLLTNSTDNLPLKINKSEGISESTLLFDASPDLPTESTKQVFSTIVSVNQSFITEDQPKSRFFGILRRTTLLPFVTSTNPPTTVQKSKLTTALPINPETLKVTAPVEFTSQVNENTIAERTTSLIEVRTTVHTPKLEGSGDIDFFEKSSLINESIVLNVNDTEETSSIEEFLVTESILNDLNFENGSGEDTITESQNKLFIGLLDGSGDRELTTENEDGRLFLGQILGSGSFSLTFGSGRGVEEPEPTHASDDSRLFLNFDVQGSGGRELSDTSEISEEEEFKNNGSLGFIFGSGLQGIGEVNIETIFDPIDNNLFDSTSKEQELISLTSNLQPTTMHPAQPTISSYMTRKDLLTEMSILPDKVFSPTGISVNKNKTRNGILTNCIDCNESKEVTELTPLITSKSFSSKGENKNATFTESNQISFESSSEVANKIRFMNSLFSENTTGEILLINEIEQSISPENRQTPGISTNSTITSLAVSTKPISMQIAPITISPTPLPNTTVTSISVSTSTTPKPVSMPIDTTTISSSPKLVSMPIATTSISSVPKLVSMPIATTTISSTPSPNSKRKRARFHDDPNFQIFTSKREETSSLKNISQITNSMTTQAIFTTRREDIVPSSEYITETTKFSRTVQSETMSTSIQVENSPSTPEGFTEVTSNGITSRTSSIVESTPSTLKEATRTESFPTSSWSSSSTQSPAPRKKFCSSAMQCNHTLNERCFTSGNYKICGCAKSFVRHPETRKCEKPVELTTSLKLPGEKFHQDLKNPNSQRYKAMKIASMDAMKRLLQNDRAILSRITKIEVLGFEEGSLVVHWNIVLAADSNETVPDLVAQIDQDIQQAFKDPNVLKDLPLNVEDAQVLNIVSPTNPCLDAELNYCSKHAECVSDSEKGFRCVCLPGFQDDSSNPDYPGEVCAATCPPRYCGYHGECEIKENNERHCLCNGWYFGYRCQISGVVAVASFSAVNVVVIVLVICLICLCKKRRHRQSRYYGASRAQVESGISPQLGGEVALTEGPGTKARRYMAISTPLPQPIIQITSPSFPGSSISYDDSTFDRTPSVSGEPTNSVRATCEIMSRV